MPIRNWFIRLFGGIHHSARNKQLLVHCLEELESRHLLTASVFLDGAGEISSFAGVGFQENLVGTVGGNLANGDADTNIGDFSVQIDWGDGSGRSQADLVVNTGGGGLEFLVKGSHVYSDAGSYEITAYANGPDGSTTSLQTTLASVSSVPNGIDGTEPPTGSPPISPANVQVGIEGLGIEGEVGSFNSYAGVGSQETGLAAFSGDLNGNLDANISDFQAYINWGDSDSWDQADLAPNTGSSGDEFLVKGSHTYFTPGTYDIVVYVVGPDGTSTSSYTSQAVVTAMPSGILGTEPLTGLPSLSPSNVQVYMEGLGIEGEIGSLNSFAGVGFQEDAFAAMGGNLNGNEDPDIADFQAYINWGDSNQWYLASLAPNTGGGGDEFLVKGSHIYSEPGTYDIVVYAVGPDGTSVSSYTSQAIVSAMPSGIPGIAPSLPGPSIPPANVQVPFSNYYVSNINSFAGVGFQENEVATFAGDLNGNQDSNIADFQAFINWGDSNQWFPAQLAPNTNGSGYEFDVKGSHVYANAGTYNIVVYTVGPDGTSNSVASIQAIVSNVPSGIPGTAPSLSPPSISPANVQLPFSNYYVSNINSFAGVGFQENEVATFAGDLNGNQDSNIADFHAFINWGDSNQWFPAQLAPNTNGSGYEFEVKGSHIYANAGTYNIVVYTVGPDGTSNSVASIQAIVSNVPSGIPGTAPSLSPPSISPANVQLPFSNYYVSNINSFAGVGFQENEVATFAGDLNGNQDSNIADFQAFINWGDSSQWLPAELAPNTNGSGYEFVVKGSHIYANAGTYNIVVYTVGPDGTSNSVATIQAIVTPMPSGIAGIAPALSPPSISPANVQVNLEGVSAIASSAAVGFQNTVVASLAGNLNNNQDASISAFQAFINWGDSNEWEKAELVPNTSGFGNEFLVEGSHTYARSGTYDIVVYAVGPDGTSISEQTTTASVSSSSTGFTPAQIRDAYGINSIPEFQGSTLPDGSGQTIAIVDPYDDPNIFEDVDVFDQRFGTETGGPTLYSQFGSASSFLTVVNQDGQTASLPGTDPTSVWENEESQNVEWAHAIAPKARIVLVEANSTAPADLDAAVQAAASIPGVTVVSVGFGSEESPGETSTDSLFTTPAGHTGVTFIAVSGNTGSPGDYPAASPNVLAVGGSTLTIGSNDSYGGETAWSGSGGGISQFEPEPAYQEAVQNTGSRTLPDVAFDADPNSGVDAYDSYGGTAGNSWEVLGGTGLAASSWAGLIAIADQGRVIAAGSSLDGPSQTLPALYLLPSSDYHTITSGSNGGFNAGPGYNEVTGLGTPIANLLIPDLVTYGLAAPSVASISPALGNAAGGTAVTITGSNFSGASTVMFGNTPAGNVRVLSTTEIIATAPAQGGMPSTVAITITTSAGTSSSSSNDQFTYTNVDLATSLVSIGASTVNSGSSTSVALQVKNSDGTVNTSGTLDVAFSLVNNGGGEGTFGPVAYIGNGIYTATFTGTVAGSNAIQATIDGLNITSTAPAIVVAAGAVFPANSLLSVGAATIQLDGSTAVTLQARDPEGNDESTGGLSVVLVLESKTGAKGTFSKVTDNHNGTYTATFTGTTDGNNVISATVNGLQVTDTAPISIEGGVVSLSQSTVSLGASNLTAGTSTLVMLQAEYPQHLEEPAGGLTVTFKLGSTTGAQGTFSSVTDHGNGTYTALFTGTLAGTNTIKAFIDGKPLTSAAPSIKVATGTFDLATSPVTVSASSMKAGTSATVTFQPEDAGGNKLLLGSNPLPQFTLVSGNGTFGQVTYNSKTGAFSTTFSTTSTGSYTIATSYNGEPVTSKQPVVTVTPAPISLTNSTVSVSQSSAQVGTAVTVTLNAVDIDGNPEAAGLTVAFLLGSSSGKGSFQKVTYMGNGIYQGTFIPSTAGTDIIEAIVGSGKVQSTAKITVSPG